MSEDYILTENRRFFGRRISKLFSPRKMVIFEQAKQDIFFDFNSDIHKNINPIDLFPDFKPKRIFLEIGFGGGEHLLHRAKLNPDDGFIGCDAFINGTVRVIEDMRQNNTKNIRLICSDALLFIRALQDSSLDGLYLLYPDPWHKKRHHKRRFVQNDTVSEFVRLLKPQACWRFASDIVHYIQWVFAHIHQQGDFIMDNHHHYTQPFEGWISTKYEQKALREGRYPHYFEFIKP